MQNVAQPPARRLACASERRRAPGVRRALMHWRMWTDELHGAQGWKVEEVEMQKGDVNTEHIISIRFNSTSLNKRNSGAKLGRVAE